jgi:hypothetical protein
VTTRSRPLPTTNSDPHSSKHVFNLTLHKALPLRSANVLYFLLIHNTAQRQPYTARRHTERYNGSQPPHTVVPADKPYTPSQHSTRITLDETAQPRAIITLRNRNKTPGLLPSLRPAAPVFYGAMRPLVPPYTHSPLQRTEQIPAIILNNWFCPTHPVLHTDNPTSTAST